MVFSHILSFAILAAVLPYKGAAQGFGGFGGWGGWSGFAPCASSCANDWGSNCIWTNGGSCFCTNDTLIANVNTCVASSNCGDSDKESIYKNIAQLCAQAGHTLTAAPEATFSVTSNSAFSTAWSGSNRPWGQGFGPFGGGWGPWGSSGSWTSGPWTNWWDGRGCPGSTWTGWTSGDWDSKAPWTSWTACSATTTATVTFTTTTTTSGGGTNVITGTSFGVKVAEGTATSTSTPTSTSTSTAASTSSSSGSSLATRNHGTVSWTNVFGALAASLLGRILIL